MCVKNTATQNVGVLSAEWFVSLKGSLIKVFVLWFHVCVGVAHVVEVNHCFKQH